MKNLFNYYGGSLSSFLEEVYITKYQLIKVIVCPIDVRLVLMSSYELDHNFMHVLNNYAVKHIMHRHSGKRERLRGQEPVTLSDLLLIPEIVLNYDTFKTIRCRNGNPGFIYTKDINDETYTLVEEVRKGHSELATTTLYKRKRSSPTLRVQNNSADSGFASLYCKGS